MKLASYTKTIFESSKFLVAPPSPPPPEIPPFEQNIPRSFYLAFAGWKRTCSVQELFAENPQSEFTRDFGGMEVIILTPAAANDYSTTTYLVDEANATNGHALLFTVPDKVGRAMDKREKFRPINFCGAEP